MAKLIYTLWKRDADAGDEFRDSLLSTLLPKLGALGAVKRMRLTVADSAVAPAFHKRLQGCQPLPDAVLSVYVDENGVGNKALIDRAVDAGSHKFQSYQVSEKQPLNKPPYTAVPGMRVFGFCQVVFLQRPVRLSEAQWLELWQGQHTQVAIDTQATFSYRQNIIEKTFNDDSPVLHAMIEESFPPEAMSSEQAFYGAKDDVDLKTKQRVMIESCARFIDFDKIDVIPMSEYCFGP